MDEHYAIVPAKFLFLSFALAEQTQAVTGCLISDLTRGNSIALYDCDGIPLTPMPWKFLLLTFYDIFSINGMYQTMLTTEYSLQRTQI